MQLRYISLTWSHLHEKGNGREKEGGGGRVGCKNRTVQCIAGLKRATSHPIPIFWARERRGERNCNEFIVRQRRPSFFHECIPLLRPARADNSATHHCLLFGELRWQREFYYHSSMTPPSRPSIPLSHPRMATKGSREVIRGRIIRHTKCKSKSRKVANHACRGY